MLNQKSGKVIDVQVNGGWAELEGKGVVVDFSNPDLHREEVLALANRYQEKQTFLIPTIITAEHKVAARNAQLIVEAIGSHEVFAGIHLEGPHLSPKCKGAHPAESICNPSIERFTEIFNAAKGQIVLTTVAPELEGALPFIQKVAELGVVVSAGHHAATLDQLKDGFRAGVTALTHAGNAWESPKADDFARFNRKDTSVFGALSHPGVFVMAIPDGRHVSAHFIQMCHLITKHINPSESYQRFVITSDASPAEGAPKGNYRVFVNLDIQVTEDPHNDLLQSIPLSGSWLDLKKCMHVLANMRVDDQPIMTPLEIDAAASTNVLAMLRAPFERLGALQRIKAGITN